MTYSIDDILRLWWPRLPVRFVEHRDVTGEAVRLPLDEEHKATATCTSAILL